MTESVAAGRTLLARGRRGAVVAPHHLATEAGLSMLRAGGHAVDAAIAANAVLGVVAPNTCGIGGDAFWLIWDEAGEDGRGRQLALNGSGRAPAGADPGRLRREGLARMPVRGPRSVTIPGAVRSWGDAHRRFGRLPVSTLLAPAIELAEGGFPAWTELIEAVERSARTFGDALGSDAPFFAIYRPDGRPWRPGEVIRLPALARTLAHLADDGFDAFYEGEVGERQAALLAELGVDCGPADFREHTSTWGEPIHTTYRGLRATTHPPNSSGVVALELLNILERFEPPQGGGFGPDGLRAPGWAHLVIEAAKLAMADRDAHLTDPESADVPVERLLDKDHAAMLAALIDPRRASVPKPATNPPGGGTAYLAAVDAEGNAVSLIQSNYLGFGSGVVDPETGVHYQNRGSYFSLDPDHPNVLGPGKRTLHTLMPCMIFREGEAGPWIVVGSEGGDAQPQIHAQLVSDLVHGGLDIAGAVAAPRWSVEPRFHFDPPRQVIAESRFQPGFIEALEAMGHPVSRTGGFESGIGTQNAIELVDGGPAAPGGSVAAVTDPRSHGLPAVW